MFGILDVVIARSAGDLNKVSTQSMLASAILKVPTYLSMVVAGLGAGLLLGVLMGLSSSPIVATVIGAAVTFGTALLARNNDPTAQGSEAPSLAGSRQWSAGAFSFACLLGVFCGLYVRTRDVLVPAPAAQVEEWVRAGYSPAQARRIVASRMGTNIEESGAVTAAPVAPHASVLFAGGSNKCDDLNPAEFRSPEDLARAFDQAGGNWKALAVEAAEISDGAKRRQLLVTAWSMLCDSLDPHASLGGTMDP